jgi:hypothetical protein
MNKSIFIPDLFGSQTEQESYVPPEISVLEINLEKGFAASSMTSDWGSLNW